MGLGKAFKEIGHGLEHAGKAVVEGAAAGAVIVASAEPATEVVEIERPMPGPWDINRPEEIVIPQPRVRVVEER